MNQLVNKYNDKNLEVIMEFGIGNDNYEIMRGLKPTLFELKKNGQPIDNLSSKKLNQGEIDKLLGINEKLFKNIVGIAVTNNKPFLSMSLGDKRELVENIFNIDILSEMAKEVKKRNTVDRSEQRIKITELDGYNGRINDNKANIEKIRTYIDQFEENRQNELTHLNDEIDKFDDKIKKNVKNIKVGEDKIKTLKQTIELPSDDEIASLAKSLGVAEHERNNSTKTLIGGEVALELVGNGIAVSRLKLGIYVAELHSREGKARNYKLLTVELAELVAVCLLYLRDSVGNELLLHLHNVLEGVDVGELKIEAGELGSMLVGVGVISRCFRPPSFLFSTQVD